MMTECENYENRQEHLGPDNIPYLAQIITPEMATKLGPDNNFTNEAEIRGGLKGTYCTWCEKKDGFCVKAEHYCTVCEEIGRQCGKAKDPIKNHILL